MTELLLIRHGQASVGAADYDKLSPIGFEQSRLLGEWLRECGRVPGRVVVGGRRRQSETASATLEAMGLACDIEVDPAFDEFDHREILLRHSPDFADNAVLRAALDRAVEFRAVFASAIARWISGDHADYRESWEAFRARVSAGAARLAADRGSVWVFTSAGPISACVGALIGIPPTLVSRLTSSVMNGSITRLLSDEGGLRLASFNATPHLDRADPLLMTAL